MKLKTVLAAALSVALCATAASADHDGWYYGDWYYDDNPGDKEYVELGDNTDDSYLVLRGYKGWCGRPGDSYATMRRTIGSNHPYQVAWRIDYDCGSTVRVCVEGNRGQIACSTYLNDGWRLD